MGKTIKINGKKFNKLTAVKFSHKVGRQHYWEFKCDCGNTSVIQKGSVVSGNTKSCGCIRSASVSKHSMSNTRFYRIHADLKNRCNNVNNTAYCHYGGRGIKCLWNTFESFYNDMYESYLKHFELNCGKTYIERTNNDGNYCLENCTWATITEQANNRRSNRFITYKNETLTLSQWAKKYGIKYKTLCARINDYDWSFERAISE